jgi:hypothetical protein
MGTPSCISCTTRRNSSQMGGGSSLLTLPWLAWLSNLPEAVDHQVQHITQLLIELDEAFALQSFNIHPGRI